MRWIILFFLLCQAHLSAFGKPDNSTPLTIGERSVIHSRVLHEDRPVYVALPYDYGNGRRHPVLVISDGRSSFLPAVACADFLAKAGRIPSLILIAIPNTARNRDFTPVPDPNHPGTGCADDFITFLETELLPWVDDHYRTLPFRVFAGHSLCGMFACHVAAVRPGLFTGIVAMSPALPYGDNAVVRELERVLQRPYPVPLRLFLSLGNEPGYTNALDRVTRLFTGKNGTSVTLKYRQYPELTHATIPLKSIYDGLEHVFYDWPGPTGNDGMSLDGVVAHYQSMSNTYGTELVPPEGVLNRLGYRLLAERQVNRAIRVMRYMVKTYPASPNARDSLGEALEASGRYQEAAAAYRQALELGRGRQDPNLALYRSHLNRVQQKAGPREPSPGPAR